MRKELYPPINPYRSSYLKEREGHKVYFEECGNPSGLPILFLHGGPGSGFDPQHRCFFNPEKFRIILMDQRGAGKSLPFACLENNTTWKLIEDIEELRQELKIEKWHIFGGSWGSTLALAYAISYPKRILSLILRGIFLSRKKDLQWFYQEGGASLVYPEEWEKFLELLDEKSRKDPLTAYYRLLTLGDEKTKDLAAKAWIRWEGIALKLCVDQASFEDFASEKRALALARIESHYFVNHAFFEEDGFLLKEAQLLSEIPCTIVHGRYDMICPFDNAWALKKALPNAKLMTIPNAGHSAMEKGILEALLSALDNLN